MGTGLLAWPSHTERGRADVAVLCRVSPSPFRPGVRGPPGERTVFRFGALLKFLRDFHFDVEPNRTCLERHSDLRALVPFRFVQAGSKVGAEPL